MSHVVQRCHAFVPVGDDWKTDDRFLRFLDVLCPCSVRFDTIYGGGDCPSVAFFEFWLQFAREPELSRAYRCEICWVREENDPGVSGPLVKTNAANRSLLLEVGYGVAQIESVRDFCL